MRFRTDSPAWRRSQQASWRSPWHVPKRAVWPTEAAADPLFFLDPPVFRLALVPPEPGTYFKNQAYFYDGEIGARFARRPTRRERHGVGVRRPAVFYSVSPIIKVAGGNVAFTAIAPFLNANVAASLWALVPGAKRRRVQRSVSGAEASAGTRRTVTGFCGGNLSRRRATMRWARSHTPDWDTGPSAPMLGFTYSEQRKAAAKLPLFTGVDFQHRASALTDYHSGDVFHLDFLAGPAFLQRAGPRRSAGYYYDQFTNDTGSGAL